ncbi:hypothetical protein ABZT43_48605 [Streptomyces sp. NPDC005349]|uniref:hypothetical protein n=1 Tax=Streptomyces sp. NPDC005349 TaxID=3157037 RepID=UPI0033AF7A4B
MPQRTKKTPNSLAATMMAAAREDEDEYEPPPPPEALVAQALPKALAEAEGLKHDGERCFVTTELTAAAEHVEASRFVEAAEHLANVFKQSWEGSWIVDSFLNALGNPHWAPKRSEFPCDTGPLQRAPRGPSEEDLSDRREQVRRRSTPIESADQALQRQAEPEITNEALASGALAASVTASVTAAATVFKAKIEATTQRRKDDLEAETQRLKIASDERVAGFQAMRMQDEDGEPDDA